MYYSASRHPRVRKGSFGSWFLEDSDHGWRAPKQKWCGRRAWKRRGALHRVAGKGRKWRKEERREELWTRTYPSGWCLQWPAHRAAPSPNSTFSHYIHQWINPLVSTVTPGSLTFQTHETLLGILDLNHNKWVRESIYLEKQTKNTLTGRRNVC